MKMSELMLKYDQLLRMLGVDTHEAAGGRIGDLVGKEMALQAVLDAGEVVPAYLVKEFVQAQEEVCGALDDSVPCGTPPETVYTRRDNAYNALRAAIKPTLGESYEQHC